MQLLFLITCFIGKWTVIADSKTNSSQTAAGIMMVLRQKALKPNLLVHRGPSGTDLQNQEDRRVQGPCDSWMECNKNSTLGDLLSAIVAQELSDYSLVLAYDKPFEFSSAFHSMLMLPLLRQVVRVSASKDFLSVSWKSHQCRGYIFLLQDPMPLLTFADDKEESWDYEGKFVIVGFNKTSLDVFASSKKGKQTEHIVGLVKKRTNDWIVYINQLYWGDEVVAVNRWRFGKFTSNDTIFPSKTVNLRGADLKLSIFEFEPHVMFPKGEEKGGRPYGRDIQIADTLAKVLNFTLNFKKTQEGEMWGFPDDFGNRSGMSGHVQRNEAHFGMGFSFMSDNYDLMDAVDFSRFYDTDMNCFLLRVEPPLPRWLSLVAPFQMRTWLAISLSLLLFCPVLFLFTNLVAHKTNEAAEMKGMTFSCLYTLGIHFRASQSLLPTRLPTQIWVLFLWLYAFILTASYCCNITAVLTVERPRAAVETIKGLHSSAMDILGIVNFFKLAMEESKNAYLSDLAERYHRVSPGLDFGDQLRRGEAAFLETRTYEEYLIVTKFTHRGLPFMRIMKECFLIQSVSITLQKHFPLKGRFDKVLGRLFDQGILGQWFSDTLQLYKKPGDGPEDNDGEKKGLQDESSSEEGRGVIPLSTDHLQGIFYIHVIGLILGIFVFIIEICCFREKRNRKGNP